MNRRSKMLLSTGAALVVTGGAIVNFLAARQIPLTPQDELTLANLNAMAFDIDEDLDLDGSQPGENKYSYGADKSSTCIIMVGTQPVQGYKPMCFSGWEYPVCADCVAK